MAEICTDIKQRNIFHFNYAHSFRQYLDAVRYKKYSFFTLYTNDIQKLSVLFTFPAQTGVGCLDSISGNSQKSQQKYERVFAEEKTLVALYGASSAAAGNRKKETSRVR